MHGRDAELDVRVGRRAAGARLGLRRVHLGDRRVDLHDPAVVRLHAVAADRGGDRQPVDREVDLHARALAAVGRERRPELLRERAPASTQAQEGRLRVGVREHPCGAQLLAACELDAGGAAVLDEDAATGASVRISRRPRAPRRPSPRSAGRSRRGRSPTGGCRRRPARRRGRAGGRRRCPGSTGPPVESLIACQPSAARTCSLSKCSARYWVAEVPNR